MCFHPEGDHAMSPQRFARELKRRPWLSPSKNAEPAALNPQHCLTPNLNAGRIHLLRKGLTVEAKRSQLGMYNSTGSLIRKVTEMGYLGNSNCPNSGRVTAPCTPLRSRPPPSLGSPGSRIPLVASAPGGQSSVVTFRFIEKASVKTLNGLPLVESRKESGLSRSLELGEALHFGSPARKQGSGCPVAQNPHSPQRNAAVSPEPVAQEASESIKVKTNESVLAGTGPAVEQAPLALSGKGQEHLSHKLKLETSASDPLLAGNRFLLGAQSSLSLGNGSPHSLNANCLSSSLTNGMISPSNDISALRRSPQSGESQYQVLQHPFIARNGISSAPSSYIFLHPMQGTSQISIFSLSLLQGSPWAYSRESSAHAQRIAKAKWEFFYGSLDPPGTGNGLDASTGRGERLHI